MLGNEKIGKLLFKLSTPSIVAMVVGAVYNVVDAIFIGQGVNSLALGALAIAFPIEQIIMSVAFMVGLGASAIISISLGEGNKEKADHAAEVPS
jgi:Na+-driven multidrug efflux pump